MTWFKYPETKPTTYERGGWDGTRSPLLVLITKNKDFHVGRMYEGTLDGNAFCDFVGEDGWDVPGVIMWTEIENPFI